MFCEKETTETIEALVQSKVFYGPMYYENQILMNVPPASHSFFRRMRALRGSMLE